MKKILASILVCLLVLSSYRDARALVAIPVAATAAATAIVMAGGVYYYLKDGGSSFISLTANIKRNAAAAYYVIDSANRVSNMIVKELIANHSTSSLIESVNSNPAAHPVIAEAIANSEDKAALKPGDIVNVNGKSYKLGSLKTESTAEITATNPVTKITVYSGYITIESYSYSREVISGTTTLTYYMRNIKQYYYTEVPLTDPTPLPTNITDLASQLRNADGSPKSQAIQDELDRAMQNPGYVPTFTDATTGLPWVPPADVVSPAQAAEYEKRQAAAAAAAAATAAANKAVDAAQAAHDAAVADAAANPSDLDLQEKVRSTFVQLANAQAVAAAAASNEAALGIENAVSETQAEDFPASVSPPPELLRFNWVAATKLIGQLETTWPFNLIVSLRGLLAPLEAPPTAPSFDLHIYGDQKLTLDLSLFDSIAAISRWAISILLTSLGIMAIVRWYRG
jgi:hypothetical protein